MGLKTFNRAERRRYIGMPPIWGPNARRSSGNRTGQPAQFKEWKAAGEAKRFLSAQRTFLISQARGFSEGIDLIRISTIAEHYPNWLALSQARRADLLKLPGIGPATLKRLQTYLMAHNLTPAWAEQ